MSKKINNLDPGYCEICGNCHWGMFGYLDSSGKQVNMQLGICVEEKPVLTEGDWRRPTIHKGDLSCKKWDLSNRNTGSK